jgi:hypothetical protein
MPGGMPPGVPRPMDVPAPFAPGGVRPQSGRPPADPFAAPTAPAPVARQSVPAPAAPDPFAAAPVMAAQEVRLIIDDKAVADSEVGRKGGGKWLIASLAIVAVGIAIGWFVGSTARERQLYDLVLADAKEVYGSVNTASPSVEKAAKLIDTALKAAAPGPGKGIEVDFKSLEELRKIEKPFPGDAFSRKYYRAFGPGVVDALFTYYNNTNLLWAKIALIANKALSPANREGLTKAAKAAGELAGTEFGCIPVKDGENYSCGLVSVTRGEGGKLTAVTRGGSYEKQLFAGQDLSAKASDYVIMVDKGRSNEILGAQTNQFQSFARDLMEAKQLADQTLEIQGRLIQQLGDVAKLEALN